MSKHFFIVKPHLMMGMMLITMSLLGFSGRALAEAADRDKPIDLEADSVKVDDSKQISTYSGNVILTQGTLVIRADKLIVREDQGGFQHSTSLGNPTTFKQKMEGKNEYMEGSALRIEYDGRMDKVQLFTKAWVKRGEDIVHGDYIMYDANAEYAEVIGGGSQAATPGTPNGRVRAIIQPKGKKPAAQPAVPAKPDAAKPAASSANDAPAPAKSMRFSRSLEVGTQPK
ncbi:MAG TPA: lipopolysaccharide transport periplasmic protein LptA [Methylotenera sp.]|jgi:lipopolysaccharide export system protein LptA|nr:lipopolysaccharide transport periplasmic protein LptA [Methylotenera sp.]HQS43783.1 lipopolysaccharide transport periplasmic protein LptA [Methylotenera sp.]